MEGTSKVTRNPTFHTYLHILVETKQRVWLAEILNASTLRDLHESSPRAPFPVARCAEGRDEAVVQKILDHCVQGSVVLREERNEERRERS